MGFLLFFLGAAITGLTVFDFLKTTVGMAGLGPLTRRLSEWLWRMSRRVVPWLKRLTGRNADDAVGPVIIALVALMWITLNCAGYTLMFGAAGALVDSDTRDPANAVQRVAFAGSALSTLGASIVQPGNGWWDALSIIAAVNGMVVLTLSVSFMMNVLQTTAAARALALRINALTLRRRELEPEALTDGLTALGPPMAQLVLALRGTPLVGYFCTRRETLNFARAVLTLCDLFEREDPRPGDAPGLAELRLALRELPKTDDGGGDRPPGLGATRAWARHRLIEHAEPGR